MLEGGGFLPEKLFFSESVRKPRQELYNALEETVAVRPHAFSIRTGSHRVHVQMSGSSFSLGPIHLAFLASPLCPSPFFQLLIHLPSATQQPSVVSHCLSVDLGREAPTSHISHAYEEEHSPGKTSSWRIPAPVHQSSSNAGSGQPRCKVLPVAHTRDHCANCEGG